MEHVAALLDSVGGLVLAVTGLLAVISGWRRTQRRERPAAAQAGAERVAKALAEAAADGELTPDEIAEALKQINDPQGGEQG
ncbi:hypothetical protein ACWEFJ_28485 [Actinosynnema sp. NPDC004786]